MLLLRHSKNLVFTTVNLINAVTIPVQLSKSKHTWSRLEQDTTLDFISILTTDN